MIDTLKLIAGGFVAATILAVWLLHVMAIPMLVITAIYLAIKNWG